MFFTSFTYQAQSWTKPRHIGVKVKWHQGKLYPQVGFIVTNLTRSAERVSRFYNGRSTAEQWIKEGNLALRWARLSCRAFLNNALRLQLFALAYNLANFLHSLALPDTISHWSLTTLREKLVKVGTPWATVPAGRGRGAARVVRRDPAPDRPHARAARCGGLIGANHKGGRSRGENHAPRSTAGTRVARIRLRARIQRLLSLEVRRRTCLRVDLTG